MALFHLLKVKCTAGFSTYMFDLSISHSSAQFKCSLGHLYKHIGMALVKHFKIVGKVLLLCGGVNLGHVGECKETLCINVFDFNNGGHIAHQLFVGFGEEFALACFHGGLEGDRGWNSFRLFWHVIPFLSLPSYYLMRMMKREEYSIRKKLLANPEGDTNKCVMMG
eukprot:3122258-Ditylum_brightwellii.AAC.1